MSYAIEFTIADRTYHYGSIDAFREDCKIRKNRIGMLKALIIKAQSKVEQWRKDDSERGRMETAGAQDRLAYLQSLLETAIADDDKLNQAASEFNKTGYQS